MKKINQLLARITQKDIVVVTRHQGLVDFLKSEGVYVSEVISHATVENVKDKVVIGVLPVALMSKAYVVISVDLELPLEMRGLELTEQDIRKYFVDIRAYKVIDITYTRRRIWQTMIKKYMKKPIVVEAIQLTETNHAEVIEFITVNPDDYEFGKPLESGELMGGNSKGIYISTLEGVMEAKIGDYIIKGVNGEFYPCKPDIFEKTYEVVEVWSRRSKKAITKRKGDYKKWKKLLMVYFLALAHM